MYESTEGLQFFPDTLQGVVHRLAVGKAELFGDDGVAVARKVQPQDLLLAGRKMLVHVREQTRRSCAAAQNEVIPSGLSSSITPVILSLRIFFTL